MVVVSFVATGGEAPDPVAAVMGRLPLVQAQGFRPNLPDGADVVFIVAAASLDDASAAALHEVDAAARAVGARCRPIGVRASDGPDWVDPGSLELSCDMCGPDHTDSVCTECSVCADAKYERHLDSLLDSVGSPGRQASPMPASACA